MEYIVKPGHALSTAKGIIGPPIDSKNPEKGEIVTEKHFKNGKKGLMALLQHKKCPLTVFESKKEKEKAGEQITDKDSQQPEKKEKPKGAEKK